MLHTRELVGMMRTVAKLSEYGSHDDAYGLLKAIDSIALGLERYNDPLYQFARTVLLDYIEHCYNNDMEFHTEIMWTMHYCDLGQCEKAWESLERLTKLTTRGKLDLLTQAARAVRKKCQTNLTD